VKRLHASDAHVRSKDIALQLDNKMPNVSTIQDCLATACLNLAGDLNELGRFPEALCEYDNARVMYDKLVARRPDSQDFRWGQAMARKLMGDVLLSLNKPAEARTMLEEAAHYYDGLVASYPHVSPIAFERTNLRSTLEKLNSASKKSRSVTHEP
jgi:tetratricopeptide (TPR) repeat protein